jgi:PAP_fibrillin
MTLDINLKTKKEYLVSRLEMHQRSAGWQPLAEAEAMELHGVIAQLEALNPTPKPLESPLIMGDWRLLYTTSQGILGLDRIPLTDLGSVYQCLRNDRVYNVAETQSLVGIAGIVAVAARYTVSSDIRVQVKFERSILGLRSVMGYRSVGDFIERLETKSRFLAIDLPIPSRENGVGQGWLEITYLDETLRISRGNEGSIFILIK